MYQHIIIKNKLTIHYKCYNFRYHIIPVTLLPVIIHLHQRQGVTTLWKGIGSVLLVRGMSLAVEDCLSKFTPWPKEINSHTTLKQFGQHMLLKW